MATKFQCPHCQRLLSVQPELSGKIVACPACQTKIQIPQMAAASQAAAHRPPPRTPAAQPRPTHAPQAGFQSPSPAFSTPQYAAANPQMGGWAQQPRKKSSAVPWIIAGSSIAAVLLVGVIVVLVIVLNSKKEDDATTAGGDKKAAPSGTVPVSSNDAAAKANSFGGSSFFSSPTSNSGTLPAEFTYLPEDAHLVFYLNVDQLMDSSLFREVSQKLKAVAPAESQAIFDKIDKMAGKLAFGFTLPDNIISATPSSMEFLGVMRAREDIDFQDALPPDAMNNLLREEEFEGHTLLVSQSGQAVEVAYCQLDSRTILYGTLREVRQRLGRKDQEIRISSELKALAQKTGFSSDATMLLVLPPAVTAQLQGLAQQDGVGFEMPTAIVARADIERDIVCNIEVPCGDEASAQQIQAFAQMALAGGRQNIADPQARSLLSSIRISRLGSTVTGALTVPGTLITQALNSLPSVGSPAFSSGPGSSFPSSRPPNSPTPPTFTPSRPPGLRTPPTFRPPTPSGLPGR